MKKNSRILLGIIAVALLLLVVFRVVGNTTNSSNNAEDVYYTFETEQRNDAIEETTDATVLLQTELEEALNDLVEDVENQPSEDVDEVSDQATDSEMDVVSDQATDSEIDVASDQATDSEMDVVSDQATDSKIGAVSDKMLDADVSTHENKQANLLDEKGTYTSKDEVALYIHLYGHLPENYISKKDAEAIGYSGKGNELWDVAPGKSIGGSRFGNYEGLLPEKKGRKYYECDIDYNGKKRNAKRIVYSNDGLIYYTEDHYESFELLYSSSDN